MSAGVFNTGRLWISNKSLRNLHAGQQLSLGLYSNALNSLTHRNVLADIVPVVGTGYAPILISAASWTTAIVQAADPLDDTVTWSLPNQFFTAGGEWPTVRGAYLFDATNNIAIAWRDAPADLPMPTAAKILVDWLNELSSGG